MHQQIFAECVCKVQACKIFFRNFPCSKGAINIERENKKMNIEDSRTEQNKNDSKTASRRDR